MDIFFCIFRAHTTQVGDYLSRARRSSSGGANNKEGDKEKSHSRRHAHFSSSESVEHSKTKVLSYQNHNLDHVT